MCKFYQHVVINSFPQRNMAVKICSRMKSWHKTTHPYIILFKDWGGVGREGLKGRRENFSLHIGKKETVGEVIFPLIYLSPS